MDAGRKLNRKNLLSVRAVAIKKGVLAHEVDEGSPCIHCGPKCPGFSLHFWRKICKNCLCPREEHDIRESDETGPGRLTVGKILFSPTAETAKGGKSVEHLPPSPKARKPLAHMKGASVDSPSIAKKLGNYTWVPKGATLEATKAFFSALPTSKLPVRGSKGERYWQKQTIRQLPAHDIDVVYCTDLDRVETQQMEMLIKKRRETALGRAIVRQREAGDDSMEWSCFKCKMPLSVGDAAVFAERAGLDRCWHPTCFTCVECNELFADLIYFWHEEDGQVYCGRHHAEKFKPRCAACDELILCREYTRAEDHDWHMDHFCCLRCDKGLGGKQYRPHEGQPYCLACYEIVFSTVCESCGNSITLDQLRLSYKNQHWHGKESCFFCYTCRQSLLEKPFLPKYKKVFCSKECAQQYKEAHAQTLPTRKPA